MMKPKRSRYTVGHTETAVWIYDERNCHGRPLGHVIRVGVLGDGHSCMQSKSQAMRLAKKVCRFLNGNVKI